MSEEKKRGENDKPWYTSAVKETTVRSGAGMSAKSCVKLATIWVPILLESTAVCNYEIRTSNSPPISLFPPFPFTYMTRLHILSLAMSRRLMLTVVVQHRNIAHLLRLYCRA